MRCLICEHPTSTEFTLDLHTCQKCGNIFKTKSVPESVYSKYLSSAHTGIGTEKERLSRFGANYRYRFLKTFKESGKLLEIGCGHQYFLDEASKDFEVSGTELSTAMIQDIVDYKIHYGNPSQIEKLELYDAICAFHVLEHMNDPVKELRVLTRHLREDGVVIFEVPALLLRGLETNAGEFYEHLHVNYFNQTSLNIMLQRCDLKPLIQITFWDSEFRENTLVCAVKKSQYRTKRFDVFKYLSGGKSV